MSMRFSPLPLTSIGRGQIFADGGTLLKICHNRPTQCLHEGGKVDIITFSASNENHKHSFFHSLASADSVSQTQATAGKDPVNAKEKTMTLNIPEEEDTAAKMYTNIRQGTAVNYPLSPKPWSIRPLELDCSTNYLTSLG